ncbi:MAG: efflux RND transporter periplasmic adaptor subunit [Acetobacteraceae bacterium]|nr:efflux RND transporter periplasmic adaptor subunit [Acetobacteraceae bacterium]
MRLSLAALASLALAGVLVDRQLAAQPPGAAPAVGAGVPVSVATVERRDVPVYLTGLGTVQSNNAVQVRARVDGTLIEVPVQEGQEVRAGQVLARIDPRPYQAALDQAVAKQQQDQAQLANAQRELARTSALARQDFASRQQLDQNQAAVAQFTAAVAADAAAAEAARINLGFTTIAAPFDGRVGLRQIDPGNLVRAGDSAPIMSISQIHPIAVVFTLPQEDLPRLAAAMAKRRLPVAALPGGADTPLDQGILLTIDNAVDPSSGTVRAKAMFPNAASQLWPGQFVRARLLLDTLRGALTVPSRAVEHGPNGLYVYVVRPNGTATRQPVALRSDDGRTAVVASGLTDGASVVTSGQSRLDEGARVTVVPGGDAA